MENKLKNLKEKMDNTILKDVHFDDDQSQQVLNSIKNSNYQKKPFSLRNKFNSLISISAISIMFLGITYFAGTQLNLFSGPETRQANDPGENTTAEGTKTVTIEEKANPIEENTTDPKKWKDLSTKGDLVKPDFPTNVNDWVAFQINEFSKKSDVNLPNGGYDEGYDYYLKSQALSMTLGSYIRVEGEDLEKDFENLWVLASAIGHEQFVRTAHIGPNGEAIEKTEYYKQWKPTNKRMKLSFEYMKQLLNDIDIAINKDSKGETFGVSHQLDGDKVEEMESFIRHFEGE
ncbi:hypothetical protein [Bacillus dakarensis]|uniref:hypothetical protein n=1 Tax=Robertmurraya dakarensis TaxID=1926278 RepID=UPI000982664E|nr:hypothetical protein [Bacillus dakarensis]